MITAQKTTVSGTPFVSSPPDLLLPFRDDPEDVLSWIQERINCHIPDKESNPELHRLVTRKQMHKCNAYRKRKRKVGSVYRVCHKGREKQHPGHLARG